MPQTRFVTRKALALGLRPIVVVNKIDRPGCPARRRGQRRPSTCSSRWAPPTSSSTSRWSTPRAARATPCADADDARKDLAPLLDLIVEKVPPPEADVDAPAAPCTSPPWTTTTTWATSAIGRVRRGRRRSGRAGPRASTATASARSSAIGQDPRLPGARALRAGRGGRAGDIVAVTGMQDLTSARRSPRSPRPASLPLLEIEEPTVKMQFIVNNGPFAGREGKYVTVAQPARAAAARRSSPTSPCGSSETETADTFEVLRPRRAAPGGADRDHAPRGLRADGRRSRRSSSRRARTARSWSRTRTWSSTWTRPTPGAVDRGARRRRGGACRTCSRRARPARRLEYHHARRAGSSATARSS